MADVVVIYANCVETASLRDKGLFDQESFIKAKV